MAFNFGASSATPAPAASGFSFGSPGTAAPGASAAPASGGFSFGAAAPSTALAAPAASGGFSFGAAAPAATNSSSGGFQLGGQTGGSSGFNFGLSSGGQAGASGTTGSAPGGFGGSSSLFGNAAANYGQQPAGPQDVKLDTPYSKLPPNMKDAVGGLWKQISEQRELAQRLKTVSDADLKGLTKELRQLRQGLGKAQSIQSGLAVAAEVVHEEAKDLLDGTERYGAWPVAQMLTPMAGIRVSEELPSPYLPATTQHFAHLLRLYEAQVEALERQMPPPRAALPASQDPPRHTIAELLRVQQAAFMHVAGSVAALHESADALRARVRKRAERDPFAAADRMEKEDERKFANRMRGLANGATYQVGAFAQQPGQPAAPAAGMLALGPAAGGQATGAAPQGGGLGFGAPAGQAFGALQLTTGTPGGGGFNFGSGSSSKQRKGGSSKKKSKGR